MDQNGTRFRALYFLSTPLIPFLLFPLLFWLFCFLPFLEPPFSLSVYFRFFLFFNLYIVYIYFCPTRTILSLVFILLVLYIDSDLHIFRFNLCITYIFPCIYVNPLYN